MKTKAKLGFGAPLAVLGALALILLPFFGLAYINPFLKLIMLALSAVLTGLGLALSISGIIDLKSERSNNSSLD